MKFEEVLPKMRDEGRVGIFDGHRHAFENGLLMIEVSGHWYYANYNGIALTSETWTLEPIKVRKWQWVFGSETEGESLPRLHFTEERSEAYRIEYEYDWMERIDHTMIEEEE